MSEVLSVPTAFGDLAELAAGMVGRIDTQQLILYGPEELTQGARVPFQILLSDGSEVIRGTATVAHSIDGGEERDATTRFDHFLTELSVTASSAATLNQIHPDGVDVDIEADASAEAAEEAVDASAEDVAVEDVAVEESDADTSWDDDATRVADVDDQAALAASQEEPAPDADWESDASTRVADAGDQAALAAETREDEPADADAEVVEDVTAAADASEEVADGEAPEAEAEAAPESEGDDAIDVAEADATDDESLAEADAEGDVLAADGEDDLFDAPGDDDAWGPPEGGAPVVDDAFRGLEPPEPPADPGGFTVQSDLLEGRLGRPATVEAWTPTATEPLEPVPGSGLFAYEYDAGIPIPNRPPRPELDPSERVSPAPRPSGDAEAAPADAEAEYAEAAPVDAELAPEAAAFAEVDDGAAEYAEADVAADELAEVAEAEADAAPIDLDDAPIDVDDAPAEYAEAEEALPVAEDAHAAEGDVELADAAGEPEEAFAEATAEAPEEDATGEIDLEDIEDMSPVELG